MPTSTLIIGGAGYIGTHLIPGLLATGRRVTVVGRRAAPIHGLPREVPYVSVDFGQRDLMGDLLEHHQEVIHLAYTTVPNTSFENPLAEGSGHLLARDLFLPLWPQLCADNPSRYLVKEAPFVTTYTSATLRWG